MNYGVAVVATGGAEYKPAEYLYGQDARVKTHLEFDALLDGDPQAAKAAENVVFIQCVGSREPGRPYCSRVCCTHSIESAIELKKLNPDMNVFIFNRDIRTYGLREDLYTEARRLGVIFVRYEADKKPRVVTEGDALYVVGDDHILHKTLKIKADYLVLATAIVPNQTKELVDLYKCSVGADGFLTEAHPKLRPVDMSWTACFWPDCATIPSPWTRPWPRPRRPSAGPG